jgi:mono/diheme cytochrome c family protein
MRLLASLLTLSLVTSVPLRAEDGDVSAGHAYAQSVCAACHAVEKNSALSRDPEAPPFAQIARSEGITGLALTVILRTPHRHMPDLLIPEKEKADVIAYILSLRP